MVTKYKPSLKAEAVQTEQVDQPANRLYVFAKNCTNTHGKFVKGDKARGAFADDLVEAYLQAGILVAASED